MKRAWVNHKEASDLFRSLSALNSSSTFLASSFSRRILATVSSCLHAVWFDNLHHFTGRAAVRQRGKSAERGGRQPGESNKHENSCCRVSILCGILRIMFAFRGGLGHNLLPGHVIPFFPFSSGICTRVGRLSFSRNPPLCLVILAPVPCEYGQRAHTRFSDAAFSASCLLTIRRLVRDIDSWGEDVQGSALLRQRRC